MTSTSPEFAGNLTPSPLQISTFRAVWMASIASNFGGLIQSVGASWMMASLVDSPQLVALVQSSTTLPIMLLSLWAGALADNFDRRVVMLCAQVFMLVVRSEEHTSELQSLMRISYAVFCLKKTITEKQNLTHLDSH